jgi:hypothetical protein
MTATTRLTLAAIALSLLVACGGSPAPDEDASMDEAEAAELGRDTDATVLDDMIETQDRARAVEDVTLGHKDDLDRALEASAGDTAAEAE